MGARLPMDQRSAFRYGATNLFSLRLSAKGFRPPSTGTETPTARHSVPTDRVSTFGAESIRGQPRSRPRPKTRPIQIRRLPRHVLVQSILTPPGPPAERSTMLTRQLKKPYLSR